MRLGGQRPRLFYRLVLVSGLAGALVCGAATAASAHAALEHTSPGSGSVVKHSPTEVTLTFGEDVGVDSQDVQVFDDQLHRVDLGDTGHLSGQGDTVGVRLPPALKRGTYTVTWRVISADSHPVSGGFTFSVGAPSKVAGTVSGLNGGSRPVGIALGAMRFLGYAALVAGPGVLVFLLVWPAGRRDRWTRRLIRSGVAAGLLSAAGLFVLQAPYSQGQSFGSGFSSSLLRGVASSHYGVVITVRFGLWLSVGIALQLLAAGRRWAVWPAAAGVPALAVTWALAGHGDTGTRVPLALVSETVHVLAVTVWLGGLLVLTGRVLRSAERDEVFDVLPRFSAVALGCVSLILVTGFYQAWREIGLSWTALITTTYGRLVAAKILSIAVLIGLGWFARRSLGAVALAQDLEHEQRSVVRRVVHAHLRQSVLLELEIGVGVLVLTSILVNTIPAKEAVTYPVTRSLSAPGLHVHAMITPGKTGSDTITLKLYNGVGDPRQAKSVTGSLSLPDRGIASLPVRFSLTDGTNEEVATVALPLAGAWRLSFDVQTTRIAVTQFTTGFTIH
jgi:copper transport protein